MMDKETLRNFFSNQATIEQQKRVLDWVEQSGENQKELLRERKLYDSILLVADMNNLKRNKSRFAMMPRWAKETIRYAAAIILIVGIGSLYITKQNQKYLSAYNIISVPAGQHIEVMLSDGTKVYMNALSELQYPALFTDKERKIKLKGEAFFDVHHNAESPFIVETYICNIEVLGTQFNVQADPENNMFITSLVEGKVKVSHNTNTTEEVTLSPNHQVRYSNGRLIVEQVPEHEKFLWRDGLISFDNTTFRELINKFERYYGADIEIRRTDIPATLFTGKIRISDGLDHALWVLKQSVDFKYTRNTLENKIYIE